MARPKAFEREDALLLAIAVFSDHGYEGTSTEALVEAMGISRQSMYDTFGGKRPLYLECLQRYNADSIGEQAQTLGAAASPGTGLAALLELAVENAIADPNPRCLGVGAVTEFGRSDREVSMITDVSSRALLSAVERRVTEAKAKGEAPAGLSARDAAHFMMATLVGIKVAARGGADAETLRGIARVALRSLRRKP